MCERIEYRKLEQQGERPVMCKWRCDPPQPAVVCRSVYWIVGSVLGVSFFYYCEDCRPEGGVGEESKTIQGGSNVA